METQRMMKTWGDESLISLQTPIRTLMVERTGESSAYFKELIKRLSGKTGDSIIP